MKGIEFKGPAAQPFNELEFEILNYIWRYKTCRSDVLHGLLARRHKVSLSTISVTLGRLYKKGLLDRKPERYRGGVRYVYYPKFTREEFGDRLAAKFVAILRKNFGETCVLNLKKRL